MSKKTEDALRKYYATLEDESGVMAYKKGGYMGFKPSRKYGWGSYFKLAADNAKKMAKEKVSSSWNLNLNGDGNTNWAGLASSVGSIIGDGVNTFKDIDDKRGLALRGINSYGLGAYDNVYDNDSFMLATNNVRRLTGSKEEDFRDRSFGQDIGSALVNGVGAGLSTGNIYVGAAIAASDFIKSLIERNEASSTAEEVTRAAMRRNKELNLQTNAAAQRVDDHNDFMRLMNYYSNPFEYAFGGEMRSHGSDYQIGKVYDVSESEYNRLLSLGYGIQRV